MCCHESGEEEQEGQEAERVPEVMVLETEQFQWSVQCKAMRLKGREEEGPGDRKVKETSVFGTWNPARGQMVLDDGLA